MIDFVPPDFASVPFGSTVQSQCAPAMSPTFKGVAINVPEQITIADGETVVLPVCGYYQLPLATVINGARITVHVRSLTRPDLPPLSGPLVLTEGDNEPLVPKPKPPPVDPARLVGRVAESYFHFDAQALLETPLPPGTYELMVTYGEAQSNVVRVEIVGR